MREPFSLLEIAVASVAGALIAARAGADRLEVNTALACGGLTPSLGLFREIRSQTTLPLLVMLRPRPGGFVYSDPEFQTLRRDLEIFLEGGADGFVFGMLDEHGAVDGRCAELVRAAQGRVCVFHRAFDLVPRPLETLEQLIDLGFRRVLTSGQERTAWEGVALLRQLVDRARGKIEILPGGGVRPENAAGILRATGCGQVHASARRRGEPGNPKGKEWLVLGEAEEVDGERVRELKDVLRRWEDRHEG